MEKMVFKISKEIQANSIEWLERDEKITNYLRRKKMKTVGDVLARQKEIPEKYMTEIKKKLIFNI